LFVRLTSIGVRGPLSATEWRTFEKEQPPSGVPVLVMEKRKPSAAGPDRPGTNFIEISDDPGTFGWIDRAVREMRRDGTAVRVEADLVDHLFNSSEKRLARLLLLMANFGKEAKQDTIITKISQETLAKMIGPEGPVLSFCESPPLASAFGAECGAGGSQRMKKASSRAVAASGCRLPAMSGFTMCRQKINSANPTSTT
jgi:hypothetical protein